MNKCNHPFEARETYGYAVIPAKGKALNHDKPVERTSVTRCNDCGALLVPNGVLVDEAPNTFPPRKPAACACGKKLTQPYALQMGECVECCLKRIRNYQGKGIMVTSGRALTYQRKYNRGKRQSA